MGRSGKWWSVVAFGSIVGILSACAQGGAEEDADGGSATKGKQKRVGLKYEDEPDASVAADATVTPEPSGHLEGGSPDSVAPGTFTVTCGGQVTFSSSSSSSFECDVDGAGWTACTSPYDVASWSIDTCPPQLYPQYATSTLSVRVKGFPDTQKKCEATALTECRAL